MQALPELYCARRKKLVQRTSIVFIQKLKKKQQTRFRLDSDRELPNP